MKLFILKKHAMDINLRQKFDFGGKIRRFRKDKGLRLVELAEMTQLSKSLLSQIENHKISPSVETLYRLSTALERPIGYFFEDFQKNSDVLVKMTQRKKMQVDTDRTQFELLSPDLKNKKMEALFIRMKKGGLSEEKIHDGEEVGLVVKGTICVTLEGKRYIMEKGDSIYFQSSVPHRIENIGDSEANLFWVMTPPSF